MQWHLAEFGISPRLNITINQEWVSLTYSEVTVMEDKENLSPKIKNQQQENKTHKQKDFKYKGKNWN